MMRRSRKLRASAPGGLELHAGTDELRLLLKEKGRFLLVFVHSILCAYAVNIPRIYEHGMAWVVDDPSKPASSFLAVLILNTAFFAYVALVFPEAARTMRRLILIGGVCLSVFFMTGVLATLEGRTSLNLLLFAPVGFASVVFAIAFDRRFATLSAGYMVIVCAVILHFGNGSGDFSGGGRGIPILAAHLLSSVIGVLAVGEIRKRSTLVKVGVLMGIAHGSFTVLFSLADKGTGISAWAGAAAIEGVSGLGYGIVAGFLLTGALPFIEYLFEVSTGISLLELTDQNHPVLRRMLLEAPGTYHHSFIVGTLAEAAAAKVGANALLARVGGYYHDIGKLIKPEYFTENESHKGSHHANLSPTMSTLIIVAHIKDGIEIGKDYNLPSAIMDFIPQHHGTSVVEYFYHEARQRAPDRNINRDFFRYLGPRPRTKETAIVFLADSVEAASRTLSDPTPERVKGLVHQIINYKLMDDQLDDSMLSFHELNTIEEQFVRVLSGIFHGRIAYPEPVRK